MWKLTGTAVAAVLAVVVIFGFAGTSDVAGGPLPGAGVDTIDLDADITIDIGGGPEIVPLSGSVDIARQDPVVQPDGSAVIDIELVELSLTGTGNFFGPGTEVEVTLDPNGGQALGQILTPPNFPTTQAEGFVTMETFVRIGQFTHNTQQPVTMQAESDIAIGITEIPVYKSHWSSVGPANNLVDKTDPLNIPGTVNNLTFRFGQPPPKFYSIMVLKLDEETGQALSGFDFNLYNNPDCDGGSLASGTTDGGGLHDFTGLLPGTYWVEEKPETDWNLVGGNCKEVQIGGTLTAGQPACPIPDEEFPQPGCDSFDSGGRVIFEVNATGETASVTLNGPTQVVRYNKPERNANSLDQVDTEIVHMELTGDSPLGPITVRESSQLDSTGTIVEQNNTGAGKMNFPADSIFNVYFEVDTLLGTLHNNDPLRLECKIEGIPPTGCFYQPPIPNPVELFDDSEIKIATIKHAFHIPLPPNEKLVIFTNERKGTPTPTPTEKQYSITVLKLDADTDDPLDSFEFNLYQGPGCSGAFLDSGFTDQDGYLDFLGLDPGSYSVEEKPKGGWNVVGDECQDVDVAGVAGAGGFVACPKPQDLPPPDAGCDSFSSGAQVNIEVNATGETFAVTLGGPTVIQRGAVGDKQPNGLDDIDTEIIQLDLTGSHPTLGSVVVRQSPDTASTGQIEEQENTNAGELDFPADSYFDIYFEVDVLGMTLHNQDPLRLECKIDDIPPFLCLYQPPVDDPIDLVDDNKDKIAKIVHGVHIPVPPKDELVIFRNREKDVSDVPGDVDCDNFLRSTDAALILQLEVGLIASLACPQNGDLDNDGLVGSVDAAIILQCDAGLFDCSTLAGNAARVTGHARPVLSRVW